MKAVIVDIIGKKAVALKENGEFIKLKLKPVYSVGYEFDVPVARKLNLYTPTKIASIAAMFILLFGLGSGVYVYNKPYSYIDIDINPSIEMTTNVFNRIIGIKGLNQAGEAVIASGKYKNKDIESCVKTVLESAVKKGYLVTEKNNAVLFTVSSKDGKKADTIRKVVKISSEKELKKEEVDAEILMEKVSIKSHEDANKAGISAGKKLLIEKLQKEDPNVKIEEYKDASIKNIIAKIKDRKKDSSALAKIKQKKIEEEKKLEEQKLTERNNQRITREENRDKEDDNKIEKEKDETEKVKDTRNTRQSEKTKEKLKQKQKQKQKQKAKEKPKVEPKEKLKEQTKVNQQVESKENSKEYKKSSKERTSTQKIKNIKNPDGKRG